MERRSNGFTLVELIVAIVIVGGVSAFLIPRSLNQTTYARTVAMNAMTMALNTTVVLAKTEHKIEGYKTTIKIGGQEVKVSSAGYPLGSEDGIGTALKNVDGFTPTFGTTTVYNLTSTQLDNCNVSYDAGTGNVTSITSGC
jgi:prepilin-type N-terminal cleavage/methylation domain-containing protein